MAGPGLLSTVNSSLESMDTFVEESGPLSLLCPW